MDNSCVNLDRDIPNNYYISSTGKKHKCGMCDFQSDKKWIVIRHQKNVHKAKDNKVENQQIVQNPKNDKHVYLN